MIREIPNQPIPDFDLLSASSLLFVTLSLLFIISVSLSDFNILKLLLIY